MQTGSIRTYAASLFFGAVLILGWYLWTWNLSLVRVHYDMLSLIVFLASRRAPSLALLAGGRGDRPEREPLVRSVALARRSSPLPRRSLLLWGASIRPAPTTSSSRPIAWMPMFGIRYHIGVDGISLFLIS